MHSELRRIGKGKAQRRGRVGFTLIELLVVIAIIAILAAILFPVFARARENARRASCQSNQKQIGLGVMQYTQDYDERYPNSWSDFPDGTAGNGVVGAPKWMDDIQPYVKSTQLFTCPSDSRADAQYVFPGAARAAAGGSKMGSYGWNVAYWGGGLPYGARGMFGGPSISLVEAPATTIMTLDYNGDNNAGVGWNNVASTNAATFYQPSASPPRLESGGAVVARHLDTVNILYADGHVKAVKIDAINKRNSSDILSAFTVQDDDNI
jgi:prepilin-type N-terminal cleavage/methylation domain-containing protein/prepilin-type processing-associated H-X9-DG protein